MNNIFFYHHSFPLFFTFSVITLIFFNNFYDFFLITMMIFCNYISNFHMCSTLS